MAKRRGNNEGSILQRPNGTWRLQVLVEGKRLSYSAKTRQECQAWLKRTISQVDSGLSFNGAVMKFSDYIQVWLNTVKENRRPTTFIQYSIIIRLYILPAFGNLRLKDLLPMRIEAFLIAKQAEGLGDRTCQLIHVVMHVILASALRKGLIGRNPMDAVEKPRVARPKRKITLTADQVQQLLIVAAEAEEEVVYQVALATGLREGELSGLKWSDINWDRGSIKIQRQVQRIAHQGLVFSPPKTETGNRILALGKQTLAKLQEHHQRQEQQKLLAGDRWQENDLIFPTIIGTPKDPHNLLKSFKRLLVKACLPVMRFHDLRHTSITLLLNDVGVPIKEAQKRAGHASPSTTINIYGGETTSKMDEIAAQSLDDLITPVAIQLHPNCTKKESLPYR
jgi:integrase